MTTPYVDMGDAELYDHYRDQGLSPADAKKHVELRRTQTAATPPATPTGGYPIASGLTQSVLDIPKGIAESVMHPVQLIESLASMNPMDPQTQGQILASLLDQDASTAEKADAVIRHTPLNLGYASERALLEATGAK